MEAMAESGVALLTDDFLYRRTGFQAGRDVVRRRFCADAVVPCYEDYYREIVEHAE